MAIYVLINPPPEAIKKNFAKRIEVFKNVWFISSPATTPKEVSEVLDLKDHKHKLGTSIVVKAKSFLGFSTAEVAQEISAWEEDADGS